MARCGDCADLQVKYFTLIWAGLWRKPMRTVFTALSIVVAFMLFGVLQGVNAAFNRLVEGARLDVLLTVSPNGLLLPLAALPQIQHVPGVATVTYQSGFFGYFRSAANGVAVFAVDPRNAHLTMLGDFAVPAAQFADFRRTRTGALVSARLAERLHWKIGDHVPVQAPELPRKDGRTLWTFDIVGIYENKSNPAALGLAMNYQYFDAERAQDNGTVQFYFEKVADPSKATEIANAIDGRFVNSAAPTHTDTERGYTQAALAQIGDLEFFVDAIIGAAFATLLLLVGSNMMQSFRDRVPEFAVMKTIGFPDGRVAMLVLCEAALLCTVAAAIGLGLVSLLLAELGRASGGDIPSFALPWTIVLDGLIASALIALSSTLPAAWRAKRLSVIDALAVQ
jgi:putative ABC transport system permease protein